MALIWRDAAREDRHLLQGFRCTIDHTRNRDGRPLFHPRPWEHELQSYLRRMTPPSGADQRLRLGLDVSEKLMGVSEQVRIETVGSIAVVKLQALAISVDARGQGGQVADLTLADALIRSADLAHETGASEALVIGWVDPRNQASKGLLTRAGFNRRGNAPGGLEDWAIVIEP